MVLFSFPPAYTACTYSKEIELSRLKAKRHFFIDSRIHDTQKIGMGTQRALQMGTPDGHSRKQKRPYIAVKS